MAVKTSLLLVFAAFLCATQTKSAFSEPVGSVKMDRAQLQALFSTPAFRHPCPLVVYDEDHTLAPRMRHAAPVRIPHGGRQSAEDPSSDGLDVYNETFS